MLLVRGSSEGAITGFFIGLSQDVISGKLVGFYSILGFYLGLIIGSTNKRLYRENFFIIIFFAFISSIAYESVVYLMYLWGVYFLSGFKEGQLNLIYALKI